MARRFAWRWALGAVATMAAIYIGAGIVAVHGMIEGLLEVKPPAKAASLEIPTSEPKLIGYRGDPQAAFGLSFEDVMLPTSYGQSPAWLVPADGDSKGRTWAIYLHGISGRRENGYRYLEALHEAGFPVLLMSYTNDEGAAASPDGMHGYGVTEWSDLISAVDYARKEGASDALLIGDSMGGAIIGQFLARSDRGWGVSALILDSPALDFSARINSSLAPVGLPATPLMTELAERTVAFQHGVEIYRADTVDAVAAFPGPLLLIHGSGDEIIPVATSDEVLAKRAGETVMLRLASGHLATWADQPETFDATLKAFLEGLKTEAPR